MTRDQRQIAAAYLEFKNSGFADIIMEDLTNRFVDIQNSFDPHQSVFNGGQREVVRFICNRIKSANSIEGSDTIKFNKE